MKMRTAKCKAFTLVCVIAVLCAIAFVADCAATRPPRREATLSRMFFIHRRILMYAHEHHHAPEALEELPSVEGYDNRLVDAWNRKIDYRIIDGDIAELRSHRQVGPPIGGSDENDIVRRFALHDALGHWNEPMGDWSSDQ